MATTAKQVAPAQSGEHKVKPEKPDENAYKISLANAEKDLATAQKKLVGIQPGSGLILTRLCAGLTQWNSAGSNQGEDRIRYSQQSELARR